jgi:hypothetical protein
MARRAIFEPRERRHAQDAGVSPLTGLVWGGVALHRTLTRPATHLSRGFAALSRRRA